MIELKNNGKLNFVLYLHYNFEEVLTGGIIAYHYLAYQIAQKGHNVYMFTEPHYKHKNIHSIKSWRTQRFIENDSTGKEGEARQWEAFFYYHDNTIAVYTQDEYSNPLGINNVARWMVYDPLDHIRETWGENEYYFTYGDQSFWPQIAALCGCKVIVMNVLDNPQAYYPYSTTPEQYREENPLKKYGVAFGFEDLQWAIDTQHLVRPHLEEMNRQNEETVDNFVKFWENQCNL